MKKPSRAPFYTIVSALVLFGLGSAWLRHDHMEIPLLPGEQKPVWLIEARIDFEATGEPVTARLGLPDNPPGFRSVTEQAAAPGYGYSVVSENGVRRGEWSKRGAIGLQTIYYKSQFIEGINKVTSEPILEEPEVRRVDWDGSSLETAAQQVLDVAWAKSSSPQSLARELIKQLNSESLDQNTALLLSAETDKSILLERLINQARIPARPALGLYLQDARRHQSLTRLVQVFDGETWVLFDPFTGQQGVPQNLLLWHTGSESILDVAGGKRSRVSFSMIHQTVPALDLVKSETDSIFGRLSIQHLPIEEQSMFKLLLLLPVGALVVVFMRIIIGLKTSGTFMPILIALAFLQTSLVLGLLSFILVVAMGLVLRTYLSRLNLLLISRIATLVVLVIFIISALSLIGYQMGLNTGMTITFFPMIIIAWTIERMSILWEEEGPKEVMVQGGGSLLVAVLAYTLMQFPIIGHLTFNFPELNFVCLALIMMMGQYTGYKLSELRRFRAMVANQEAEKGSQP